MKYAVVKNGEVVNTVEWDGVVFSEETGAGWSPEPDAEAISLPDGSPVSSGYSYLGGTFEAPPQISPPPVTAPQVLAERSGRLTAATREIDPLQDLVDLGEASEDDEDKLLEWKQYRVAVSKVQTQPGFPESVEWPAAPAI